MGVVDKSILTSTILIIVGEVRVDGSTKLQHVAPLVLVHHPVAILLARHQSAEGTGKDKRRTLID